MVGFEEHRFEARAPVRKKPVGVRELQATVNDQEKQLQSWKLYSIQTEASLADMRVQLEKKQEECASLETAWDDSRKKCVIADIEVNSLREQLSDKLKVFQDTTHRLEEEKKSVLVRNEELNDKIQDLQNNDF